MHTMYSLLDSMSKIYEKMISSNELFLLHNFLVARDCMGPVEATCYRDFTSAGLTCSPGISPTALAPYP